MGQTELDTAFDRAPIGIALLDLDGGVLRANAALCELTGYLESELECRRLQDIAHADDLEAEMAELRRLREGEVESSELERRCVTKRGRSVWTVLTAALVRDWDGRPHRLVVHVQDLSERRRAEQRLQELAGEDPVTALWNRHRFEQELQRQIGRCRRYEEEAALLIVDVDGFKRVNDRHGHRTGDAVIRTVGRTITERVRATDALARIGGDQFALLLLNVDSGQAERLAEELRDWIEAVPPLVGEQITPITASIGVAHLDRDVPGDDEAFLAAETAMYAAKHAGRNRVVVAPSPKWALLDSNQ